MSINRGVLALLFLFTTLALASAVQGGWKSNGVRIAPGQGDRGIISDGDSGAIVAYNASGIYAQRVDKHGAILWPWNTVAVGSTPGASLNGIVSDRVNGAIIVWTDNRNGNADIYAQHVDSSGTCIWSPGGVAICIADSDQQRARVASDGQGGAIIAWCDTRNGDSDIYAQRIDANGVAQWIPNGVPVCEAEGNQGGTSGASLAVVAADALGSIMVWADARDDTAHAYGQKVDANGQSLWTSDGIDLGDCDQDLYWLLPQIVSDDAGGAIFMWATYQYTGVRVQRADPDGILQWGAGGVEVFSGMQNSLIAPDGAGGAIIVTIGSHPEWILAQRVDHEGGLPWGSSGIVVVGSTSYPHRGLSSIASVDSREVIVTWDYWAVYTEETIISNIFASKLGPSGVTWSSSMPIYQCIGCPSGSQNHYSVSVSDSGGGAIVAWSDIRNGIYAARVNWDGQVSTLLQSYGATFTGGDIAITWILSEANPDAEFFLFRGTERGGSFEEMRSGSIEKNGMSYTFWDRDWEAARTYWYRVDVCESGERKILFETGPVETPSLPLTLFQNHPNPFNPMTRFEYYLPKDLPVTLEIYDSSGRLMRRLVNQESKSHGRHSAEWNGRNDRGESVSSGLYFYLLKAGKETISRKMILMR